MYKVSFLLKIISVSLLFNFLCLNDKSIAKAETPDFDVSAEFRGFAYGEVLVKGLEWRFSSIIKNYSDSSFTCNLKAYFSIDENFDSSDTLIAEENFYLSADDESFEEVYVTLDRASEIQDGIYYLIVNIDESQSLPDVLRDNNTFIVPMIIEDNPTDILISEINIPAINLNATNYLTFNYKLSNTSNYVINNVEHSVYISSDSILDYDKDIQFINDLRELDANENKKMEWRLTIPEEIGEGDYFLIIDLDKDGLITEINEENNQVIKKFQLFEAPLECDIILEKENFYPQRIFPGESVYLNAKIQNNGNITSYTDIAIYVSPDTILDNDRRIIIDRHILSPGEERVNIFQYLSPFIPDDASVGMYYIICTAESLVETGVLNNNKIIYPFEVIDELDSESPPDFDIYNLSLRDSVIYNDYHNNYDFSYCNNGGEIEQDITLIAYLSNDSVLDDGDFQFEGSRRIQTPRINDSIESYANVYVPANVLPGEYFIIFKIDGDNIAEESNENNNIVSKKVKIKDRIKDISIQLFSNEDRLMLENSFIKGVEQEINIGVLSDDLIDGDSVLVLFTLSDTLGVNDASIEIVSDTITFRSWGKPKLTIPEAIDADKYYLKVEVRILNGDTEIDLSDNYKWLPVSIIENSIDLQIDTLWSNKKATFTYQLFEANISYSNISNNYIDWAKIKFYLSEDTILNLETDMLLSEMYTSLSCFQKKNDLVELSVQSEMPSGDYYIISSLSYKDGFEEVNDMNNLEYTNLFIKPDLGDLFVHEIIADVDTLVQGQIVTGNVEILNIGNRSIDASYMNIFFSSDELLNGEDILIDSVFCESMNSYGLKLTEFNVDLPNNLPVGDNYIIFSLDHNNLVEEVSDTNNVVSVPVFFVKAYVDLYVDTAYAELETLGQGLTFKQNIKLGNKGNADVEAAELNIYLSKDTILETSTDSLINEQLFYDIQPDFTLMNEVFVTIPATYDTGKAFIIFDMIIAESDFQDSILTNNRFINEIDIQEPYHHLVSEWENNNDISLLEGDYEDIVYNIINNGNTNENGYAINVYLSSDSISEEGDSIIIQLESSETIYGGSQERKSLFFRAPYGFSGEYYLILDIVTENDLTMQNTIHRKIQIVDGYLDFSAKILDCPRIVKATDNYFNIRVELENNGDVLVVQPYFEIYYSTDSILDDYDSLARDYTHSVIGTYYNSKVILTLPIPETVENINYILFVTDPYNKIQEEDENNNLVYFAFNFVTEETKGNIQIQDVSLSSDSTSNYTLDYTIDKDKFIELDTIQIQVSWCSDTINPMKNVLFVDSIFNWSDKILSGQIAIDSNLISDAEAIYLCIEILQNDYDTVYTNNVQYIQLKSSTTVEIGNELDIDIFPNPLENELHINSDFYIEEIRIYNLQGVLLQIVSNVKSNEAIINLESLKPSEYFIGIKGENNSIIRKIIKK